MRARLIKETGAETDMKQENAFLKKYVKIIVVLAVLAGSSSGIYGRLISASALVIGFWRLTMGLPFFAIPVFTKYRAELLTVSKHDKALSALAGLFLFLHFFTWFSAVKMTNIASASVIGALHSMVVLLITVLVFKQRVSRQEVMGIVLALLGGAVVAGLDYSQLSSGDFAGDMMAFLCAVFMGLYFAVGNEVRKRVNGGVYVFMVFFSCWVCFSIACLASRTPVLGYPARDYLLLLGVTITCQIGAHAAFNLCMGYVSSLYVSAIESGDPVFATILAALILGQKPTSWQIAGCVVVVAGLLYYNYSANKRALAQGGGQS